MFKYSNELGFLYARSLFSLFLASDYSNFTSDIIKLNEEEFKNILKTKEFKEFLIRREHDYSYVSDYISEKSFDYDNGYGKLLEINPGKYDITSNTPLFNETYPTIITIYNDPLFFTHEEEVYTGNIDFVKLITKDNSSIRPIIRCNNKLNINEFDTFVYLVNPELNTMLSLLRESFVKDKNIVTGLVSNIFDKYIESKVDTLEKTYEEVDKKIPGYFDLLCEEDNGTVLRLIHTLR